MSKSVVLVILLALLDISCVRLWTQSVESYSPIVARTKSIRQPSLSCCSSNSPTNSNEDSFSENTTLYPENLSRNVISRRVALGVAAATFAPSATSSQQAKAALIETPTIQPGLLVAQSKLITSSLEESLTGFVAGAALAATKTVVKYPLDTATVRLQMPNRQYLVQNLPKLFDGSFNGVTTALVANIPGSAVFFAVRDACKASMKSNAATESWSPWIKTCLAVAVAQIPYWLVRNPSEVVKTRQQAKMPGYTEGVSMVQGYYQVWLDASESIPSDTANATQPAAIRFSSFMDAFYLGYWENILYAYPADVIKFLVYDQWTRQIGGKENLSPAQGAVAGAVSTAIAQFITTPLDVVRNRLMANASSNRTSETIASSELQSDTPPSAAGLPDVRKQKSLQTGKASYWQTLKQLAETEGLPGLFSGATPRVGKAMISGAIQFATYEETKRDIADLLRKWGFSSGPN